MLLNNVRVWDPKFSSFSSKNVLITNDGNIIRDPKDEQIEDVVEIYDLQDEYTLFPGLLDTHIHGHGGFDFAEVANNEEALETILTAIGQSGTSYVMATLVSLPLASLIETLKVIDSYVAKQPSQGIPGLAQIVGVHLEGPFIAKNCNGAHDKAVLQECISLEIFENIIKHAPNIKEWKITISPDLIGALDFIKDVRKLQTTGISVKVFLGHANPEPQNIMAAIDNGAAGFTHLGNACLEKCSRSATPINEDAFTSELVKWVINNPSRCPSGVELIVDGVHLSSHFVKYIHDKLKDKIVLVSDSLGPSGLQDGKYKLGPINIVKEKNSFYIDDPVAGQVKKLAGSGASLADCIKTYWQWTQGKSIYAAAVENPRKSALSSAATLTLPDHQNAILLNQQGEQILSICHGQFNCHNLELLSQYRFEIPKKKMVGLK